MKTTQKAAAQPANNGLAYAAHGLNILAIVLLVVAAVGWLTGGAPVAAERFGLALESTDARAFAELAGIFKGLLDLFPVPLMIWFALRRLWSALSATLLVALVFIPGIDLVATLVSGLGTVAIHIPYIIALGGGAILYVRLAAMRR
jgi:hypothetical protein